MNTFRRVPVPPKARKRQGHKIFPAPTRGWVTNESVVGGQGGACRVLENWFPEADAVRVRGGCDKVATIGNDPVTALFTYNQAGLEKLFACSATDIYNVTSLNPTTPPSADVSSQTSGYYSTAQMATAGGEFLYACNEADAPQLYNGTTWTQITGVSSPAITGVTTTLLRAVWEYRNRLFFIERDSLRAWYLPVESVGGAALDLSLAGVFRKGGNLLYGATWSLDAGDGVDDKCVFISDLGEVAVYEGGDPGDVADWRLVGRYDISAPLGKNCHVSAGGDLLIGTVEGIVPLTEIIQKDAAALSLSAVTRPIEQDWKFQSRQLLAAYPWEMMKFPERNMMLVSLPHTTANPVCFVVNLLTGAWAKYTGWDVQCLALFGGDAYFGSADGEVYKAESGGQDNTASYLCRMSMEADHLGKPGVYKAIKMARGIFRESATTNPKLSVAMDYSTTFPSAPSAAADGGLTGVWDSGVWDTAIWDDGTSLDDLSTATTRWVSMGKSGYAVSPQVQITVGNNRKPDARLVSVELIYETGGLVV